ncbi:MAG TPA: formate dehydrogenase accessory sulfurtransferase FdhD [Saprospiraceae bacterium]|nr:formate dehydrogenase accessory sulfurtransferase FdhD [Saprospiraceae bacterium]
MQYKIKNINKLPSGHINEDKLAIEEPLEIVIQYQEGSQNVSKVIAITMRTPGMDEDLVSGFLYSESLIQHYSDIESITPRFDCANFELTFQTIVVQLKNGIKPNLKSIDRNFYVSSSCGVCGKSAIEALEPQYGIFLNKMAPIVNYKVLLDLPEKMKKYQKLFYHTGGIHACALFDQDGELLFVAEDVGRHNALDKLIGQYISKHKHQAEQTILLLSGRVSFEMVQKSLSIGIPVIAAIGAPSSLAVELSETFGQTLVGFMRGESANIYSHPQRIK